MCFNCREPLSAADRASPLFEFEKRCPYCASGKTKRFHQPKRSAYADDSAAGEQTDIKAPRIEELDMGILNPEC